MTRRCCRFATCAESLRKLEHERVLREHGAPQLAQSAPARFLEQAAHQRAADADAEHFRIDNEGELGDVATAFDVQARLAVEFALVVDDHVGGRRQRVDVGESVGGLGRQLVHPVEGPLPHLFGREPGESALQRRDVIRSNRTQSQPAAICRRERPTARRGAAAGRTCWRGCRSVHRGIRGGAARASMPRRVWRVPTAPTAPEVERAGSCRASGTVTMYVSWWRRAR